MNTQTNPEKRRLRNDLLLVAALLAVAAAGLLLLSLRGNGDTVEVTVNGEPYAIYPLSQTVVEEIRTGDDSWNRLVIRDGKASVEEASCPDGICAAHRAVFRNGESIVCLPNGVVITVVSAAQDDVPDMVV